MPLTPEDVRNKRFTPVRLREGYDMGEVDEFLDEVEAELIRRDEQLTDLREQAEGTGETREPAAHAGKEPQPPAPATAAEASGAATRLLELATRNAEQLVEEAREQADRLRAEAAAAAERLQEEARAKAERMEAGARSRSEQLDSETTQRRARLLGDLEREREQLDREISDLRGFEREYRSRLRAYFQQQLKALDGEPTDEPADGRPAPPAAPPPQPSGLRALLGEDEVG